MIDTTENCRYERSVESLLVQVRGPTISDKPGMSV